ncbi:MAG: glycosyltransferase [Kiritimatiellae bacterium]|nr:glycosyltransferase [Kiritimatiellia bacterium]NLD90703.1 glycosyltransferase [Lentisphaerota bacterium]HPC18600.1 glycosyltransferase [Kiritimatiellia bacterium]HQQ61221.1 glycosyltransferase [Kiritimatiellia bacterium]
MISNKQAQKHENGPEARAVRILFVVGTLELGGAEDLVSNWCVLLKEWGFDCHVLCLLGRRGPHVERLEAIGVPISALPEGTGHGLRFIREYATIVRGIRPNIVHSQCAWSLPQQTLAVMLGGTRHMVLTVHNTYPRGSPLQRIRRVLGFRLASRRLSRIVGVSRAVSDHARNWWAVPTDRIVTIPNGIWLDRFLAAPGSRDDARALLGFPLSGTLVASVASFCTQKDHRTLLSAAAILAPRFPQLRWVMVGDGPLREQTEQDAAQLHLADHIAFLGKRTDVPRILHACDMFASSSRWEGLPLAVVEAQAAALPVVATQVGGIPDIVEHGKTGFLIPPEKPEALAEVIATLAANPDRAARMGAAGREKAAAQFDIRKCARQYAELYRDVLNGKRLAENARDTESIANAGP